MNSLYTVVVLAFAIACVTAQRGGGRGGQAIDEFGEQSQASGREAQQSNLAAAQNNLAESRGVLEQGVRSNDAVNARSGDRQSLSAAERTAQQESVDAKNTAVGEEYKSSQDFTDLKAVSKNDFTNRQGINVLLEENLSEDAAVAASEGNQFEFGSKFGFNEAVSADAVGQSQAGVDSDFADLQQVQGIDQNLQSVQAEEGAGIRDDFFLNAGQFDDSAFGISQAGAGQNAIGGQSGFDAFGGGLNFGGNRGGFGGGGLNFGGGLNIGGGGGGLNLGGRGGGLNLGGGGGGLNLGGLGGVGGGLNIGGGGGGLNLGGRGGLGGAFSNNNIFGKRRRR